LVAGCADALFVHDAEIVLCQRVAAGGQRLEQRKRQRIVADLESGDGIVERFGGGRWRGKTEAGRDERGKSPGPAAGDRRSGYGRHGISGFLRVTGWPPAAGLLKRPAFRHFSAMTHANDTGPAAAFRANGGRFAGTRLVLASHNEGKLREIDALLRPFG